MTPLSSRQVRSCEHYKHKAQGDNKKVGTIVAKGKEDSPSPRSCPIRANKTQVPVGDERSTLREDVWNASNQGDYSEGAGKE